MEDALSEDLQRDEVVEEVNGGVRQVEVLDPEIEPEEVEDGEQEENGDDQGEDEQDDGSQPQDENQSDQSFGRDDPKNHMEVTNQDQDIQDFKAALLLKYESFKRSVVEKYSNIRLDYLKQLEFKVRENERENTSALDFLEQQLEEAVNEKDAAIIRASQSRIILANTLREKYNTHYLKRACFQSWKYFYEWKKYKEAKSKF